MTTKTLQKEKMVVIKNGKPTAVILDIAEYQDLLARLEDTEDLAELQRLRKETLKFRKIEDFLDEVR